MVLMQKQAAILAVAFILLLSGCISVDYAHKVERSGDSLLSMKIDMSALTSMAAGMNASQGSETDLEFAKVCDEAKRQNPDIACAYTSGIITLSGPLKKDGGHYAFSTERGLTTVRYTLVLEKMPELASGLGQELSGAAGGQGAQQPQESLKFTDPKAATQAKQSAALVKMAYVVEMPGRIVQAEGADVVTGNSAKFDVLKMMENGQNIVVVSEEADYTNLAYLVVVVLVLGGIFMLFRMRQQGKKLPIPTSMAELKIDPALSDYIKQCYAAGYTREQIRKELLGTGWQEKDVDYALKNFR
ncbi:MAG: hypothetical protein WC759_05665 [Candidatus Micrarchaeia archaeon]